jgi:Thoeris protein ThsB, TIR-like domain
MSDSGWHHRNDGFADGAMGGSARRAPPAWPDLLPQVDLARLADVIDAELERFRVSMTSVTRLVIEDEMPVPASSTDEATVFGVADEAIVADHVPPPPPPSFLPAALLRRRASGERTSTRTVARKVYFAFDFDDLTRVETVRQTGKVGLRETIQRGFYDRAVWESRAAKNAAGLLALMREAVKLSSAVCVLVGANTWRSRWVKYEIARALVEERGLLAVHISGIGESDTPERAGLNPLCTMGLYQHENGHCYLVERHETVKNADTGELGFEWRLYQDHPDPVLPPRYVGGIGIGRAAPLSLFTAEHDFTADDGATHIGAWVDAAAASVGW